MVTQARLLGRFTMQIDGSPLPLRSARVESLLAFLLLNRGEPQSRPRLAGLLWPNSDEAQARTNLRHLLHTLRRDLAGAEEHLEITGRSVCWRRDPPIELDVAVFEGLLDAKMMDAADRRDALRSAVAGYRGELLEGCDDEWLREDRERLRRRHVDALLELANLGEAAGELDEAAAAAERLLRADPLREDAHRLLIRVYGARADRASAVRAYHRCASTLERELGVEPSASTQGAYVDLLTAGRNDPPPAARPEGRPALVGRNSEQAALVGAWHAVAAGSARMVLVGGEAGVGKTRLIEELHGWCARRGATTVEARCYPAEGPLAYGSVADWLRHPALRPALPRLDRARLTELARIVPELLQDVPDLPAPRPLPEHEQRRLLFDAVSAAVLVTGRPVLLVIDDLPYADRESCQLLHYLLRARPEARLLVAATGRTEDLDAPQLLDLVADARRHGRLTEVDVDRLTAQETSTLAERLTGTRLEATESERLFHETEGNPLFVVEAVRAGRPAAPSLSPQVQSVIATRLARLGPPAHEVLAVAAAVGREFTFDVLAAASGLDEDAMVSGLDELWRRRIVRERDTDTAAYDFTHDRIRQVAYAAIGPARQRLLHARIAGALEHIHARAPGSVSAQIAVHHERSGNPARAITWYHRAAEGAERLHANARSLELLERALTLLSSRPPSRDRDVDELELRVATTVPLLPLHGYASPAMTAALRRSQQLVRSLGVAPSPPLVRTLALDALTRADFAAATRHGELLQAAGERAADDVLVVEAAYVLGVAAFWQADLELARRHFETAIARYDPQRRFEHLMHYGQDPKVVCLGRLACALWFLGRPTEALCAHREAMAWSAEIGHPYTRSVALTFGSILAIDMGDESEVRGLIREYVAAADGMHSYMAAAFDGYVRVLDGDARGLAAIDAALHRAATAPLAPGQHAMVQRLQLAALLAAADGDGALAAADRLLEMGGPARLWAPLARRVRAELAVDAGGTRAERRRNGV